MAITQKIKLLDYFKGKSLWISIFPITIALYLLFSMISISLSQIFLSLSFIFWIIMLIREKQKIAFPSFFWPLLAYIILSIVSVFFSVDTKTSLIDSRELLLFLIVPILYTGFREETAIKKANLALLASAYASSIYYIYCFFFKTPLLRYRTEGFIGQVMTQAGLLLLFCCMALSIFLLSKNKINKYLWGFAFILSFIALILAQTRSAWIGLIISVSFILFIYKPKTLITIPLVITLIFIISPKWMKDRVLSSFNPKHKHNTERVELMKAGIKIIFDFPFFGTGPNTVDKVFKNSKYGLSEEAKKNVHLHNNIIQTAAERGIPTFIAWLAFFTLTFLSLFKLLKNKDPTLYSFTVAALGALIGLFIAGFFEYNFADSEITALFLYMITIPFALNRIQEKSQESAA